MTPSEVLAMIDPVDPDNLKRLEGNRYEALWSSASPSTMDIEILRRTPGVEWVGSSYEPSHLRGWTAVQFGIEQVPA